MCECGMTHTTSLASYHMHAYTWNMRCRSIWGFAFGLASLGALKYRRDSVDAQLPRPTGRQAQGGGARGRAEIPNGCVRIIYK